MHQNSSIFKLVPLGILLQITLINLHSLETGQINKVVLKGPLWSTVFILDQSLGQDGELFPISSADGFRKKETKACRNIWLHVYCTLLGGLQK